MLMSSGYPLKRKQALILRFLAWGVPLSSYFLKLDMLRSALSLFHDSSNASFSGSFDLMMLDETGIRVDLSTP